MSGNLDAEICDEHLEAISREYLTEWQKLRPHLGLSYAQEMDISKSAKDSYGDQKRAFLYAWKQEKGSEATYQALITAANKIGNIKLADNVKAISLRVEATGNRQPPKRKLNGCLYLAIEIVILLRR